MPYEYLPDIAIADVAFRAWSETLEGLFQASAAATMNVMVGNPDSIIENASRQLRVTDPELDLLLLQFLQELIFYKDADRLLLRISSLEIRHLRDGYELVAEARGEEIDPARHELIVDVKAVTLHRFRVERTPAGWESEVVLDI